MLTCNLSCVEGCSSVFTYEHVEAYHGDESGPICVRIGIPTQFCLIACCICVHVENQHLYTVKDIIPGNQL